MVGPNAASLTRYRATVQKTLVETVHNARANADMFCRLRPTQGIQIPGLEEFVPYPAFEFICAWDANLRPGDTLTSTSRGTLSVFSVERNSSFNYDTRATVALVSDASGASMMATNELVTFVNAAKAGDTIPAHPQTDPLVPVFIRQTGQDLAQQGITLAWNFEVYFKANLVFPSGKIPMADDKLIRTAGGYTRTAILTAKPVLLAIPVPLKRGTLLEAP